MKPIIKSASAMIHVEVALEYVDIGHGCAVYRLSKDETPDSTLPSMLRHHVQKDEYVRQGFATMSNIKAYLAGKASLTEANDIFLSPPNWLKHVARLGWSQSYDECTKEAGIESWNDIPVQPYVDLIEKGVSVDRVVKAAWDSHMVFKLDGTVLPVAIYFGYIEAHFNDGAYDLPKALEILKKNPRVHFADERGNDTNEGEILDVQYYNRRPWNSRYLSFRYEPTPEEAVKLWEKQKSYGTKYPSTAVYQAVFDLDILGLRAGGAAYYDTFDKNRAYDDAYKETS